MMKNNIKFISEIGINHKGSMEIAKELIDISSENNCWAIKFQYRNIGKFYKSSNEIGDEMILDEIKRSYLSLAKLKVLKKYAHDKGLKVGISFFNIIDFEEIVEIDKDYDFFKIPSAEFSNFDLIKSVSNQNKQIIMSTGGHSLKQIMKNINKYKFINNPAYLLCTSNYPAEIGSQNLSVLNELKKIKNITVGYSSHDKNYEIPVIAGYLGANIVERHITLDKYGDGLDDSTSSDPDELKKIMHLLNNYQNVMGNPGKPVNQGEILNMQNLGTSLYAKNNIEANQTVVFEDFEVKAPRIGLSLSQWDSISKKILTLPIRKGDVLTSSHFKKEVRVNENNWNLLNEMQTSLPVRFHDLEMILNKFNLNNFELHLSYKEVSMLDEYKNTKLFENKKITIHLPDYLNKHTLFDPFSQNKKTKTESIQMIEKVIDFYQNVKSDTDNFVLVSSIGVNSYQNKEEFYINLEKLIKKYKKDDINYLPQWLPKKAWYFGGSFDTEVFSDYEDIELINLHKIYICLDVAHLIMSANSSHEDWKLWYKNLINFSKHLHVSDSIGEDGEGVEFGKGQLENLKNILLLDQIKVLEVWQGHLNNFTGFSEALNYVAKIAKT